jgi:uncharacterized membrane protein
MLAFKLIQRNLISLLSNASPGMSIALLIMDFGILKTQIMYLQIILMQIGLVMWMIEKARLAVAFILASSSMVE